jgi:hypothetical protein
LVATICKYFQPQWDVALHRIAVDLLEHGLARHAVVVVAVSR